MRVNFAKVVSVCLFITTFCITPYVGAAERVAIPRSEEKEYCPAFYDTAFCSRSQGVACLRGVSVLIPTPTSTPTLTKIVTPTAIQIKDSTTQEDSSHSLQTAQTTDGNTAEKPPSLDPDKIFVMINTHRTGMGLSPFQKEEKLCTLAQERGPELYDEIFVTQNVHAGFDARNLPYWITENMKHGDTEEAVFQWWLSSSLHRKAIEGNFLYSCGECYGKSCVQLFTSYQPK